MKKRKIALCGSMKVKDQIIALGEEITKHDFEALLPEECIAGKPKNEASRAHFKRIIEQADAILVVNATTHDTENYIGPNSFAEIAIAFYYNKPVFLWHDVYEPYRDELDGWDVTPLKGNLNNLVLEK